MTTELKVLIVKEVLEKSGHKDIDTVMSIAECVKNDRFLIELNENKLVKFLSWEDNLIDDKRYIFINNLWIHPEYRHRNSMICLIRLSRMIFKDAHTFYWFDRKKQKMVYRRNICFQS